MTLQQTQAAPPSLDTTPNSGLSRHADGAVILDPVLRRARLMLCWHHLEILKSGVLYFHYALGRAGYITSPLFPQLLNRCGQTFSILGHPQGP